MRMFESNVCLLLLCALMTPWKGAQSETLRVDLRPLVQVADAEVTLGDVAALSTTDLPTLKRLMALPLGPAPRAGESLSLGRAELGRWVQVRTGISLRSIEWAGADTTQVLRVATEVSGERLASIARQTLQQWLVERNTHAEIGMSTVPRNVPIPTGALVVKARPIPRSQPIGRRLSVWLDLWVDGRFVRTVPVGFDIAAYGPAYVAIDGIAADVPLNAAHLEVREIELSRLTVKPLPVRNTLIAEPAREQQLSRPVAAGEVISIRDVQVRPAVARGDWVALRIHAGGLSLESRAEALQNANTGQTVVVKAKGASGTLQARVLAPGEVEVTP